MNKWNWSTFNKPMFTPVIDRFILLGLIAFMSSLRIFAGDFFRSWQGLITMLLIAIIMFACLRPLGKRWRNKKGITDRDIEPNEKTEKIFMNIAVGISVFLFITLLILNIAVFGSFNWPIFLITGLIVILCVSIRLIRGKLLENKTAS